ncbi:hypothetical protein GCM10009682_03810 [Luedemannella flava]|uniref:Uncharacterized protein n=1 Tax=Luedemannella flava TaxID=349316 RepID=A0ABP4XJ46_9ACTN
MDFAHGSCLDLAQLCGSVFLCSVGAGRYSLDAHVRRTVLADPRRAGRGRLLHQIGLM